MPNTKKTTKKTQRVSDVETLLNVEKEMIDTCEEFTVLGSSKQGGLVSISRTKGDDPVQQIKNYEKLLLSGMVNLISEPNKKGDRKRMKITQGKLDLAMCMVLDLISILIELGAHDFAGVEDEVCNDDSWVEESDIMEAYRDDVDVRDIEEDDDDEDSNTTLVAPKSIDELSQILGTIFDVNPKTLKKVLETDGKSETEVKCFAKKLSKGEMAELKKVLDKLEGEEEE